MKYFLKGSTMKKEEKLKKVKDISLRECNSFFKRVILKKKTLILSIYSYILKRLLKMLNLLLE